MKSPRKTCGTCNDTGAVGYGRTRIIGAPLELDAGILRCMHEERPAVQIECPQCSPRGPRDSVSPRGKTPRTPR